MLGHSTLNQRTTVSLSRAFRRTQMAMRSVLSRSLLAQSVRRTTGGVRLFSDDKGRVLGDEERAAENVYIKKMERERLEKQRLKAEKEKAEKEKEQSEKKH